MTHQKKKKKALFVTMWLILLLGFGLWWFSKRDFRIAYAPPKLHLTSDLESLFDQAWIEEVRPTKITVRLRLTDGYRQRLGNENSQLNIGFEMRGGNSTIKRGSAPCLVTREINGTSVQLENPDRVSPREIHLYLAH